MKTINQVSYELLTSFNFSIRIVNEYNSYPFKIKDVKKEILRIRSLIEKRRGNKNIASVI
jgi:hypothetical protein